MKILIALPALMLTGASPPDAAIETSEPTEKITTTRTSERPMVVRDFRTVERDGRIVRGDRVLGTGRCDELARTARRDMDRTAPLPPMRKLNELPPAEGYYAVWRTDEFGCPDPVKFDGN